MIVTDGLLSVSHLPRDNSASAVTQVTTRKEGSGGAGHVSTRILVCKNKAELDSIVDT